MAGATHATSFLRFGDKVTRILEDAAFKLRVCGSLPSDTGDLRVLRARLLGSGSAALEAAPELERAIAGQVRAPPRHRAA